MVVSDFIKAKAYWFIGIFVLFFLISSFFFFSSNSSKPRLKILTHSSFVSDWGVGPVLKERFEKDCECHIEFVSVGSAGLLVSSLKIQREVSLVLGFSDLERLEFSSWMGLPHFSSLDRGPFIAYDWSPMAFLYNRSHFPQKLSEQDLWSGKVPLVLADFKKSSVGRAFMDWLSSMSHKSLKDLNVYKVLPSWSHMYNFFRQKEGYVVFSYLTSLVYHREKQENSYDFIPLTRGHSYLVDYLGIPKEAPEQELALRFVRFLMSKEVQKTLMLKNYMLSVYPDVVASSKLFSELPEVKLLSR